ncbi:conserved hypothetical protein [Sporisorium reilianum SRZ2]|uniref:Uncharacterized protein n=1 Tax=Sporisorium reilianum (strain SRZ2) TaxID=999809 RepID=E7A094_SPORE|nr:conserved hypothetical protein [Sporisorium reilianum SRZ2]
MRLRTLLLVAVTLLAWAQLVHCTGFDGSFDSLSSLEESDHADDATSLSPPDRHGLSPARIIGTAQHDESMLSHIPRPPPVLTRRPRTGEIRPRGPQGQAEPVSEVKVEPPEPHPMLGPLRVQALDKGKGKLRRAKMEDDENDVSLPPRAEGEGKKRMLLRGDSSGRAGKVRNTDAGGSKRAAEQAFSPLVQRADAPRLPPTGTGAHPAVPAPAAPDAFLTNLFQSYHTFPHSGLVAPPHTFNYHGLRYGHFPATEPLAEPPAFPFRDPNAGSASVIRPADVRWTFRQVDHRRAASEMARSRYNSVQIRAVMAGEAKRLYQMEADKIHKEIEKHSLPLDTSSEWRDWVREYGGNLLMTQVDPSKMHGLPASAVYGRDTHNLAEIASIPLSNAHEKWAAKFLVAWWTKYHERLLRMEI